MNYVISLGGSLIVPEVIDLPFLKEFRKLILVELEKGSRFILVTGGGNVCRAYQQAARELSKAESDDLDRIGIASTRINAELIRILFLKQAYAEVITDPFQKVEFEKILICSGWKPGRSTDYVAVQMAKNYNVENVINLTNVDFVYDKDPKESKDAKRFTSMSFEELKKSTGGDWKPGMHTPFDPQAAKFAWEEKKQVMILGKDIKNLGRCLRGEKYRGTVISEKKE